MLLKTMESVFLYLLQMCHYPRRIIHPRQPSHTLLPIIGHMGTKRKRKTNKDDRCSPRTIEPMQKQKLQSQAVDRTLHEPERSPP